MRRLPLLVGALLLSTAAVSAADCTIAYDNTNPNYAPDDTSFALLIDGFEAVVGAGGRCATNFSAHSNLPNDPDVFEVYTADVRGFVGPEDDDEATVTVTANGRTYTNTFTIADDPVISHYIGKEADGSLRSEIDLKVTNAVDPDATLAQIDTIDYALAGSMTRADAEDSLADIGTAQTALVTHLDATSALLTGGNLALEGDDEVSIIGGVGSYMMGGNVRYNLSDGFSVLAGVSLIDQSAGGASYNGFLGAAALRYVEPSGASQRFFGEVGANVGALKMSFSRSYTATTVDAGVPETFDVTGSGTGGLGALYVKGGVLFELDSANQVALSASVKQSFVGFGDYREEVSADNLFAADLSGDVAGFTTAKIGADWTMAVASDVDLTAHVGVGTTFANQGTSAYILGGGTATGEVASTVFAEYGLVVSYALTPDSKLQGFVQGSTGTGIGTHAQVGAAYRMSF